MIAVEPDAENLVLLRKNLAANGCGNVTVIPAALGDEDKPVLLYESADGDRGEQSINDFTGAGEARATRVRMRRGDAVMAEIGRTARIAKMDVEGAEPLVFAGLGSRLPQVLLFEYWRPGLRASGHDPLAFLESLVAAGYSLAIIDPDTGQHPTMDARDIERVGAESSTVFNILALSRESSAARSN